MDRENGRFAGGGDSGGKFGSSGGYGYGKSRGKNALAKL
jgi:hypothetical protein